MSGSEPTVIAMSPRRPLALAIAVLALLTGPAYAGKHKQPTAPATYDISYPQCGKALPGPIDGGIVGVNGGIVLSGNPCLATEYAWAQRATTYAPAFYANTGNPGPAYSSHWPAGQQTPQVCSGANDTACSYDYGWNAAKDSFARAAAVTATAASATWWLDVETGNSWQTLVSAYGQTPASMANDRAALAGAVAALSDSGVTTVGIYSTSYQWGQITGGTGTQFAAQPVWVAGVGSLSNAQSNCRSTSFTGGKVLLAQYALNGYDADLHCA
jgi:hypothetical protein